MGPVELEHGELGVVPGRDALVAEVAVDLVDLLQAADHQALEVQLGRHAQVEIQIERVVVGDERPGRRAAGDVVHHRRLDFEKTARVEEVPDGAHDLGAAHEGLAHFRVDDQVDIALAVAGFLVGQAVPFLRQRPERLGQQRSFAGMHAELAGAGAHQAAGDADDIADIPVLEILVDAFGRSSRRRYSCMRAPLPSWICTKLALPMIRRLSMRPARLKFSSSASSDSCVQVSTSS
jgi:hypothetical protein